MNKRTNHQAVSCARCIQPVAVEACHMEHCAGAGSYFVHKEGLASLKCHFCDVFMFLYVLQVCVCT